MAGERVGTLASLRAAATSRRIGAVTLQSFSSGLPLGLVWIALPAFLTYRGRTSVRSACSLWLRRLSGLSISWSPLMDRWAPRFGSLGARRSWILVCQAFLLCGFLGLAAVGETGTVGLVAVLALLIAFGSASQDIVIDAYAVEVLERKEQGIAVGARTAFARSAVLLSGAVTITFGQRLGWPPVFVVLGLLFVPLAVVVLRSPEPAVAPVAPRTLREAVVGPLIDLFRRAGILPILGFLVLYKFGENLATALVRPFLIQKCYVPEDVGLATATIGLTFLITGTIVGGASTERFGLTRCLWIFGAMQDVGFLGLIAVDQLTPGSPCAGGVVGAVVQPMSHRLVMYSAIAAENLCQGMATGAFGVLLLRMTQKKFSATQYALFSSIFAIGRILPGPIAGFTADALGWTPFFLMSTVASLPGLLLLQRFAPLGGREPQLDALGRMESRPVSRGRATLVATGAGVAGFLIACAVSALLSALKAARLDPAKDVDYAAAVARLLLPSTTSDWVRLGGLAVVGLVTAAGAAAFLAARYGVGPAGSRPAGADG